MTVPLRIAYLQEDTDLSGGVRVVVSQADALIDRGHQVTLINKGHPMTWRSSRAEWLHVGDFADADVSSFDFIIGTFWTSVSAAWALGGNRALHLCQGFEGAFSYYRDQRTFIEAVYRLPIPKLVVSRHLVPICRRYFHEALYVGQIVDEEFFREPAPREHEPLRLLLSGASQIDIKGVDDGYGAVAHARWRGAALDLVRVSPWAPSRAEPIEQAGEFHVALPTHEMTRLMHSCDLFLGPNHAEEGFGLPAAEAMASGIPTVLTRIPSYLSFDATPDYALFADERDPEGMGELLFELAGSFELREQLRERGSAVAAQFRTAATVERLEAYLLTRREILQTEK